MKDIWLPSASDRQHQIAIWGKDILLKAISKRIISEMTPNTIEKQSDIQTNFKKVIAEYLQTFHWSDPFWLWVIRGFPKVFWSGVSGVAASFTTQNEKKYVFKTQYKRLFRSGGSVLQPEASELEAMLLRSWKSAWVSVPNIVAEGTIDFDGEAISYYVMDFVQSPLNEKPVEDWATIPFDIENHMDSLYHALAKELACMHSVTFSWYGAICKNEYGQWEGSSPNIALGIKAWKDRDVFFDFIKNNYNLSYESYRDLMDTISQYVWSDLPRWWVLLHDDIGLYNTIPISDSKLVVIDPLGKVWHPYEDLAWLVRRIFMQYRKHSISSKVAIAKDVLSEYAHVSWSTINESVLVACLFADAMKRFWGMMIDPAMNYYRIERDMVESFITYLLEIIRHNPISDRRIDLEEIGSRLSIVLSTYPQSLEA